MDRPAFDLRVYELGPDDPRAPQPSVIDPDCKVVLKPHQLTLLQRCVDFEGGRLQLHTHPRIQQRHPRITADDYLQTSIGIIGDKMGAGKSFIVLGLAANPQSRQEHKQYKLQTFGNNKVVMHLLENNAIYNTTVIVVPHVICNQWKDYVEAFSSSMKYAIISNNKTLEPFRKNANLIDDYKVIILSSTMHNSLANLLLIHRMKVSRIVYDEVDSMSLPNAMEIPNRFCWFVTASYGNLLYPRGFRTLDTRSMRYVYHATGLKNNGHVRNLFYDLMNLNREFMSVLVVKNADAYVDASFNMLPPLVQLIRCKASHMIGVLQGLVDRNVMECLNANDERSAIELIDSRQRHSENSVIEILINKYKSDIHNTTVQLQAVNCMHYMNAVEKSQRIARLQERIEEYERRIASISERITSTMMCPVCYDDIKNKSVTPCGHAFCFKCIHVWINLQSNCPICKTTLVQKDVLVVPDQAIAATMGAGAGPSTSRYVTKDNYDKVYNLMMILRNRPADSKFLVFSNYDMTFYKITEYLKAEPFIKFSYLKGNKNTIKQKLDQYRNSDLDLLLVNATNYGSGLNLENTTDVVMFHKCDTEIEKQVIGRAQRAGRTSQLRLWYLVHDNEAGDIPA
jgi:SNF2 family DNA or RNA helicase